MLTIAMIVKDETEMLKHTLSPLIESKSPIFVLDTGSEDNTVEYLEEKGVTVFKLDKWNKDFSFARNWLLDKIKTKWVLFLDADEYIQAKDLEKVQNLIKNTEKTFYYFPIYQNNLGEKKTDVECNYRIKLFRTDKGYKYIRPVNEHLNITDTDDKSYYLDTPLFHWGNDVNAIPERFDVKTRNYIKAFTSALENPEYRKDSMLFFQAARHFKNLKDYKQAYSFYRHAILYAPDDLTTKFMYYYSFINLLLSLNKPKRALKLLMALEKRHHHLNKPLYFTFGKLFFNQKELKKAKLYLLRSLEIPLEKGQENTSYPFEAFGYFQYLYLGIIEQYLGNNIEAEKYLLEAKKLKDDELVGQLSEKIHGN